MMEKQFKYIGPLVKEARQKLEMTQEQLAEHIGVTARYIMAIENEGKIPAFDVLFNLVQTLGISAEAILYPENELSTESEQQFTRLFHLLSKRDKNIILSTMQAMLDLK